MPKPDPVTQPGPRPEPRPQPAPAEEKKLEPFYAVFDFYMPLPPTDDQGRPQINAAADRWRNQQISRVAFRISGQALDYYATQARRAGAGEAPVTEQAVFKPGGYYYLPVTASAGNLNLTVNLLFRSVGASRDNLAAFGRFQQPPLGEVRGGLPNLLLDISRPDGQLTFNLNQGVQVSCAAIERDRSATSWSNGVRNETINAIRPFVASWLAR